MIELFLRQIFHDAFLKTGMKKKARKPNYSGSPASLIVRMESIRRFFTLNSAGEKMCEIKRLEDAGNGSPAVLQEICRADVILYGPKNFHAGMRYAF